MAIILRYVHVQRPDGTLRKAPFIPIHVTDRDGKQLVVNGLIDSGADNTVVPKELAELLGLSEKRELETAGIGGKVKVKEAKMTITVVGAREKYSFNVPVLVMQESGSVPLLLGRNGFFENFHVTFRQDEEKIMLKKIKPR